MRNKEQCPEPEEFVCPKTGRRFRRAAPVRGWRRWIFPLVGLGSLLWFLVRVIPKPSRANYPCMRVVAPLASMFVVWLCGLGAAVAFHRACKYLRRAKYALAGLCLLIAVAATWTTLVRAPLGAAHCFVPTEPPNTPLGTGRGLHPGRVSWAWDPNATQGEVKWDNSAGYFWDDAHNNQSVIDELMGKTVRWLAGEETDAAAWDALFRYSNRTRGRGDHGYIPGEKIAIKVNLNTSLDWDYPGWNGTDLVYDPAIYHQDYDNDADNTPHAIKALLRELTTQAGVPQEDIYIYDSVRYWNDKYWNFLHPEFPNVHFMDVQGYEGREKCIPTANPVVFYSKLNQAGQQVTDSLPTFVVDAAYMINYAVLKKTGPGITVCGKNHFGSLDRNPVHLHEFLTKPGAAYPEIGDYSAYVDLMAHPDLGGKTVLYVVDALWAGWGYGDSWSMPVRWKMPPFNNDYPSSLFASQDPVAIDSVALDFMSGEDPTIAPGADSYLHEAALIPSPPSGTSYDPDGNGIPVAASLGVHEHWNNKIDKQYSRNLGRDEGIELISSPPVIKRTLSVSSTPISGIAITANPTADAGTTPYSVTVNNNHAVTLTAPSTVTSGGSQYQFAHWSVNGTPQTEGQINCALTVSADTTAVAVYTANRAPVANDDTYSTPEDTTLSVSAPGVLQNDTDADGDTLTIALVNKPAQGTLSLQNNGAFTYTPPANYHGSVQFTYRATDGNITSNTANVSITVTSVNDAPVATAGTLTTLEDIPASDSLKGSDVDGDALTFSIVTNGGKGTAVVTNAATGAYTYTPNSNATGNDSFTFRVSDGALSATATISVTITPVNDAPVATNGDYAGPEDTPINGTLAATDVDGDPLTFFIVSDPAHGSVDITNAATGTFTYTPSPNYSGEDIFTFQANDGKLDSNVAQVTILVSGGNDAPTANGQFVTTPEDTAKAITLTGSDPDGDQLIFTITSQPAHGALSGTAPNLTYTPAQNYNGLDSFTFTVSDGQFTSAPATVNITVTPVNDPPVAVNDSYTTAQNTPLTVAAPGVKGNDSDVDSATLTAQLGSGPAHGTLTLNPDGSFTYTPGTGYTGPDSFTYRVSDGTATSNLATVNITVTSVNTAPVATGDSYLAAKGVPLSIPLPGVLANDTDANGDVLTAQLVGSPAHGTATLKTDGGFTYTPVSSYIGADSFTYRASDGKAASGTATVTLNVLNANWLPIDIRPGVLPNTIVRGQVSDLQVAIYSTATVDATRLSISSLRLAGAPVRYSTRGSLKIPKVTQRDLNGDKRIDLLVSFCNEALSLTPQSRVAYLQGSLSSTGPKTAIRAVLGMDSVVVQ